jgi:predicted CoA-substrate-specific enzyme activase
MIAENSDKRFVCIGMDIGSTTIKVVVTDAENKLLFKDYRRHYADIEKSALHVLNEVKQKFHDCRATFGITGSAGMGVAERCRFDFIQEVIACNEYAEKMHPEIKTLIDIGGEDAKMIFFRKRKTPDVRMNGNCAGGTGSFIDQVATLLNMEITELSNLAENSTMTHPIASRCGVFCKTDIQNLLSRNVPKEDIAASVFHAVSMQVISSLARGYTIHAPLLLCGGPFTFLPYLSKAFIKSLHLKENDVLIPEHSEVIPAWGAAIHGHLQGKNQKISDIILQVKENNTANTGHHQHHLKPLFTDKAKHAHWVESKKKYFLKKTSFTEIKNNECFIGIDSGSTTTKIIAFDSDQKVFFHFYEKNAGNSLHTLSKGLTILLGETQKNNIDLKVKGSCVTGYGEDLIKAAFPVNFGMVETIAHYLAARSFNPEVSFILDIGGQDMKATFIENGVINRIEINEACSSGCGSFIEAFADSLNYTAQQFAQLATFATNPCDLGTRCTVFMNSKVKQSLREGNSVADISAGLGYSVIKNCLNKVLKIKNTDELGSHIMVQGGTFRNQSVLKALENEIGKEVMITDFPELMGAYGAALQVLENSNSLHDYISINDFCQTKKFTTKNSVCKGCENLCSITHFQFENDKKYVAGNKCEKVFSNSPESAHKGINLSAEKYHHIFDRKNLTDKPRLSLGIPRALNTFENYPFWHALFTHVRINVVLSDISTIPLYEKGIGSVMSDNICFPAKLANGHIMNLITKNVDRIFMPFVVYEQMSDNSLVNSYNCPVVSGYSEVITSAVDPAANHGIPFDAPSISFKNKKLLKKSCYFYLHSIAPDISRKEFNAAFEQALAAQENYENGIAERCKKVYQKAISENRLVVMLAGRPYHTDSLIQHKISEVFTALGVDVITEDIIRNDAFETGPVQSIMQWAYTNRIIKSAIWAANSHKNLLYFQLTSFGCGPDAFILDEINDIVKQNQKNITVLKIDDINNVGSTKLRIRSLIDSLKYKADQEKNQQLKIRETAIFEKKDRYRKILMPWFADFYSPFLPAAFELFGYEAINLPPSDQESAEFGLKYSNNEICYPATLIVGDFMKALESNQYASKEIALGISQTGGQCRATNYLTLLKKALIAAGYDDIPVISISMGSGIINQQPGFKIKWTKIIKSILSCLAYADCLSQFYYSTAPREKTPGSANALKEKFIQKGIEALRKNDSGKFYKLIKQASEEFLGINSLEDIPKIGIVGEIFVKYNNFGHKNVINWLISQKIEPVVPPLTNFFTDGFVNRKVRIESYLAKAGFSDLILVLAKRYVFYIINKMQASVGDYPYFYGISNPYDDANNAKEIINLNAQFGEGWRIPAEFSHFAKKNINNVVSLQPFGCIANHIVAKGIEKRTRQLFPELNLLFLDFDSGMGEANIYNRLHFMINNARKGH